MVHITCFLQLEFLPPKPETTNKVLGVDLGRTDIAVTSEGDKFSGREITQVRDQYTRVRTSLQKKASKGTRSSRRRCRQLLQRLSGRGAIRSVETLIIGRMTGFSRVTQQGRVRTLILY